MPDTTCLILRFVSDLVNVMIRISDEVSMTLSIIAAMAENRVIGKDNLIPWQIPVDLQLFRKLTMGHPVIMGRKTYESIGHPLSGRKTIIISRSKTFIAEGCVVVNDLSAALASAGSDAEPFVAGGGELYRLALPFAQRIYLSILDITVEGDTTFPEITAEEFVEVRRESITHNPECTLVVYQRKSPAFKMTSAVDRDI